MADCCVDPLSNEVIDVNLGESEALPDAPEGETFRRCKVCGRRHFSLVTDPLVIKLRDVSADP